MEKIEASYDFNGWLQGLGCQWRGHTSSAGTKQRGEDTVRVFRFMKRKRLSVAAQVVSTFQVEDSPDDVVLLVKQSISSDQYLGEPQV